MYKGEVRLLPKQEKELKRKLKKNVNATTIDTHMYEESVDDIKNVKEKLFSNYQEHEFVEQLTEDLFHCLYKVNPEINHEEDVVEEQRVSNSILKDLAQAEQFEELRKNTMSNLFNSTLSLSSVQDQALSILRKYVKEDEDMKDLMDNISKAQDARKQLESKQDNNLDTSQEEQLMKELLDSISKSKSNKSSELGGMMNEIADGMKNASDIVNDVNDVLDGFGGNDSPQVKRLKFDEKLKLADALKHKCKFKQVCDKLGRMKEMVNKVGKKPAKLGKTICDVGFGNKLPKVLSSEKVKLIDEQLELDFYKKFSEKSLLEFKTSGQEDGRGPIVVCIDESGSMNNYRDIWAKAFTIACIQIAVKQKRYCKVITFSHRIGNIFEFDKKKIEPEKLVDFASYFLGGGTDFMQPLTHALNSVNESKYKKADILFITDGCGDIDPVVIKRINALKSSKELRIQSVLIGDVDDYQVRDFSDSIVRLTNLNDDSVIMDVFDKIQR